MKQSTKLRPNPLEMLLNQAISRADSPHMLPHGYTMYSGGVMVWKTNGGGTGVKLPSNSDGTQPPVLFFNEDGQPI